MIEAMDKAGRVSTVRIVCDDCGKDEVVVCDYERVSSHVRLPNEGQANRKITGQGWEMVKGKHGCPACKAKRKNHRQALAGLHEEEKRLRLDAEETPNMTKPAAVTPLREPTREQKRQIMSLLEVSYDPDAGRYKGTDTDATVAGAIGGGVMPGWVAELREEFFGPDGGNGEMEARSPPKCGSGSKSVGRKATTPRCSLMGCKELSRSRTTGSARPMPCSAASTPSARPWGRRRVPRERKAADEASALQYGGGWGNVHVKLASFGFRPVRRASGGRGLAFLGAYFPLTTSL